MDLQERLNIENMAKCVTVETLVKLAAECSFCSTARKFTVYDDVYSALKEVTELLTADGWVVNDSNCETSVELACPDCSRVFDPPE